MNPQYRKWALTGIRIILGILLLASGIGKLIDNSNAIYLVELMATKFYWMIEYAQPIVITLSIVEVVIAAFLLANRYIRVALSASLLLFLFFIGVLGFFFLQGINVSSCGCFGAFGLGSGIRGTLSRNIILVTIAIVGLAVSFMRKDSPESDQPVNAAG